jgi:catechol 2,3-dioxygenase-like lactoylglutathione lyase family enzyme
MSAMTRRQLLSSLPVLAVAPVAQAFRPADAGLKPCATFRMTPQAGASPIRVRTLSHFGLAVTDPKRSVDFYRNLFGLPIQARAGANTILRIGAGPQFISIGPAENAAPSINHFCLGVENFNVDRIMAALAAHGVVKGDAAGPMKAAVTMRDGTPDLLFGDPDGIVCQLQDQRYCGGSGPLGNVCAVETSPQKSLIALKDLSHLTIFSTDAARSNKFYQDLFGLSIRSYQGPTAPTLAVGPTVQFLMFTGGGPSTGSGRAGGRGAAPVAPPRPASINHGCFSLDGFKTDEVIKALESFGIKPREGTTGPAGPLRHYTSMRMENRGGAPEGTPELYFTDPDGLLMQLQDTSYCGGGGVLGNTCK